MAEAEEAMVEEEDEEEEEEVEWEGREIPLGSTTFAACFDARTLKKNIKKLEIFLNRNL